MIPKITEIIKEKIKKMDRVTPELYNQLYIEEANKLNYNETQGIFNIDEKFKKKCDIFKDNTNNAIIAIDNNDIDGLNIIKNNMKKLEKEIIQLKNIIFIDELTKKFNRKYLYEIILDSNLKFNKNGFISIIDLNDLKYINDNIGHNIGDKVICFLTKKISILTKNIVRFGGDEFLLFFDEKESLENIFHQINDLRNNLLKKLFTIKNDRFKISFSFSISKFSEGDDFENILDIIDKQMYIDKEKNKPKMKHIKLEKNI